MDFRDVFLTYIRTWRRFRKFSSIETLCCDLNLSRRTVQKIITEWVKSGFGRRKNQTASHRGGIVWDERVIRPFFDGANAR